MNSEWTFRLIASGALAVLIGLSAFMPAAWGQTTAKPPAKAVEPLGRMFFTPAQRASLDIARARRAQTALSTEKSEDAATAAPVAQSVTFGGMVRRSDGKSTIWINNRPYNEQEQISGPVVGRIRSDGSVLLQLPQSGRSIELKVGQTVELVSGTVEEAYGRKPPAAPEAKPAAKPSADKAATKPAPAEATLSEREREFRDQQRLEDAIRAVQDTAPPKPSAAPAPVSEGPAR